MRLAAVSSTMANSRCRNGSTPVPLSAETRKISACAKKLPRTNSRTSSSTKSNHSSSTKSALLITTTPRSTPKSRSTSRCSRDCGITPSSAAMTSMATSMVLTPATMVLTKRSWPGTSMIVA